MGPALFFAIAPTGTRTVVASKKTPNDSAAEILFLPKFVVILFTASSSWHGGESAGFHRYVNVTRSWALSGHLTVFPLARACPGLDRGRTGYCRRANGTGRTAEAAARSRPAETRMCRTAE